MTMVKVASGETQREVDRGSFTMNKQVTARGKVRSAAQAYFHKGGVHKLLQLPSAHHHPILRVHGGSRVI